MTPQPPEQPPRSEPLSERRAILSPDAIRRLGVPRTVISDAELHAAITRDARWDWPESSSPSDLADAAYDRRGLLNVLVVAAEAAAPDPVADPTPLDVERLAKAVHHENYGDDVTRADLRLISHKQAERIAAEYARLARLDGEQAGREP